MRIILSICVLLNFFACKKEKKVDKSIITDQVERMLRNYYSDVSKNGLTAEFKYLDNSKDFFWNPPGYYTTLTYGDVVREVTNNSKLFQSMSYQWDTLKVFPLSNSIANYTGIVSGEMIDLSGKKTIVDLLESGTAIKRSDGWKILSGQTTITKMEPPEHTNNETLFVCYIKLAPKYIKSENWTDETHNIIEQHSAFMHNLGKNGTLIFAGRTKLNPNDEKLFGIAVLKIQSLEKAEKIISDDPAVINKIQEVNILPFSLGINYFQNLE